MKREDQAIANIIRLRREQAKLRKKGSDELINYKSRVVDLAETFLTKQPSHRVTAYMMVQLAEIAECQLVRNAVFLLQYILSNLVLSSLILSIASEE